MVEALPADQGSLLQTASFWIGIFVATAALGCLVTACDNKKDEIDAKIVEQQAKKDNKKKNKKDKEKKPKEVSQPKAPVEASSESEPEL